MLRLDEGRGVIVKEQLIRDFALRRQEAKCAYLRILYRKALSFQQKMLDDG